MTSLYYDLATSENLLKMERILNSKPTKASNVANTRWTDLMRPLSITEIIAKSNIDFEDLDTKDVEVMRLCD